tara:strand:+ start:3890 stop:4189 length:300 start_codon:yes stop_codon:yes gene_type:complete
MAQAITTRYLGPTNHNGSRILAKCSAGRLTHDWNHALNPEDNHKEAAQALIAKLGWTDGLTYTRSWAMGSVDHTPKGGYVHVPLMGFNVFSAVGIEGAA